MGGILTIGAVQAQQVGAVLAEAFHQEAASRWLEPDPDRRGRMLAWLFGGLAAEAFVAGTVNILLHDHDAEPVGAAVWLDRATDPDESPEGGRDDRVFDAGEGSRWRQFERVTTAARPSTRHAYLVAMGVHPDHRGRGLGSRLLRQQHDVLDATGTAAYVETASAASRALYAQHGYRDHGEPIRLPDGPALWPMWRVPEAPRAHSSVAGRAGVRRSWPVRGR